MKKILIVLLLAVLALSLAVPALAEEDTHIIRVNGTASVSLAADTATLYLGAATREQTAEEALKNNTKVMADILAAAEKAGIPKEDIITSQYNVQIISNMYGYATESGGLEYEVSNVLYITVRNLENLSAVIDEATKAGANNIYGLEFSNAKTTQAYEKAMTLAVENAKANAKVLAAAAGRTLGEVVRVEDMGTYRGGYGLANNMEMLDASDKGAAIVSGDVSVTSNIVIEFELAKAPLLP